MNFYSADAVFGSARNCIPVSLFPPRGRAGSNRGNLPMRHSKLLIGTTALALLAGLGVALPQGMGHSQGGGAGVNQAPAQDGGKGGNAQHQGQGAQPGHAQSEPRGKN